MNPAEARRAHPASLALLWFADLRPWLLPLGALLLFSIGDRDRLVWMWLLVPTLLWRLTSHWSLRYLADERGLWIREGLFERKERRVLAERITHLSREQPALARLLGLCELRFETSSGGAPEAVLRYVSTAEAERVARLLGQARSDPQARPTESGGELRLSAKELLYLGLFGGRGWALAIGLYALCNEFGLLEALPLERFDIAAEGHRFDVGLRHLVLITGLLILVRLLALVDAWLRYGDFRLRAVAGRIEIQSGLLNRREARLEPRRLQRLALAAGPLDRRLARATLKADAAGAAEEPSEQQPLISGALLPTFKLTRWNELRSLLGLQDDPLQLDWRPFPAAYVRKERYEAWMLAAAAGLGYGWFNPLGGLCLAALLLGLAEFHASSLKRVSGYTLTETGLWIRSGRFTRRWLFLPRARLEVVQVHQSPWLRRFGLFALEFDSAHAQSIGTETLLPGLSGAQATALLRELCGSAGLPAWLTVAPGSATSDA